MKVDQKQLKGFAVGLSMAGIALFSSTAPQAAQRLCTGACQGCYACGITAVPLLAWLAWHGKRTRRMLDSLRRAGSTLRAFWKIQSGKFIRCRRF